MTTLAALKEFEAEALPGFVLADVADWQNEADKEHRHVFADCLPYGAFGVLAAPGGASKTTLALQVCAGVATGLELVPGFRPNRRGRALFICAEDPAVVAFKKLKAMPNVLPVSLGEIDNALRSGRLDLVCEQPTPLLEFNIGGGATVTPAFDALVAMCTAKTYDLICIDPLLSFAGLNDENSNASMQLVAGLFVTLAKTTGAGIVILHHANKQGERGGDMGQTLQRGGSAFACASRAGWGMRPWGEKDAKDAGISSAEAAHYVELVQSKNSYKPLRGGRQLFRRAEAGILVPANVQAMAGAGVLAAIVAELEENPVNLTKRELVYTDTAWAKAFREGVNRRTGREVTQKLLEAAIDEGVFLDKLNRLKLATAGAPRYEIHVQNLCES